MTPTELAILAAPAAAAVAVLLALRARRSSEQRLGQVLARVDARLEAMVHDLTAALEQAQEDGRRARLYATLTASIELDDVVARTLEAAVSLRHVDAAALSVPLGHGAPLVAGTGLEPGELSPPTLVPPPDGRRPRAVSLAFAYEPEEEVALGRAPLREGFLVPLVSGGEQVGVLGAYARGGGGFAESFAELEELGRRAATALENARRFRLARDSAAVALPDGGNGYGVATGDSVPRTVGTASAGR